MIHDICTVIWKEWKSIFNMEGRFTTGPIPAAILIVIFAIFSASEEGAAFLSSWITVIFTVLFAATGVVPSLGDAFAGERERYTLETLLATRLPDRCILFGKIAAVLGFGWAVGLLYPIVGFVVVNVSDAAGGLLLFRPLILISAVVGSLLLTLAITQVGVLVSLRATTVKQAQQVLTFVVLAIGLAPLFLVTKAFPHWQIGLMRMVSQIGAVSLVLIAMAALALVNAVLLLFATARFQRARLV